MFSTHSNKQYRQILSLVLCCVMFVGVFMLATTATAHCATTSAISTGIENAFSKITEQAYNIMKAIIVPCCIVALAYAGFQFLIGGTQGAEKARKVVIGCACAIGFVIFAPLVVSSITSIIQSGQSEKGWSDYNPLK